MKKIILLPVLSVISIALFSFAPPPNNDHIITAEDGEKIISSTVAITPDDQQAILNLVQSYGNDYGYLVYKDAAGNTMQYGMPVDPQALQSVDAQYGSDLANIRSFQGVLIKKYILNNILVCESTQQDDYTPQLEQLTTQLNAILSKYE
ncbi:MAG: hypothetical protein BGO69_04770 [Bacteroidetes bacterium 46-16]|nr:MAG: hypothetical protein BGO69_04770 [Bacteroidetes bacterium 46-16]